MRSLNRIANFFSLRQYLLYLLLFGIAISLFTYLQFDQTFADPDSFYHAKMAEILADQGAITEFPWLSATNLKYKFVDHHFLYHLILIPFVKLFPPLIGLKIATVIFASLTILVIFWFLKQLEIRGAFWYALFLLTINPFIFRLNLGKAQPLVLIFLFLFIYCLFYRRYLCLILLSSIYIWLYGGWPLTLVLAIIYCFLSWLWPSKSRGWLAIKIGKIKVLGQNFLLLTGTILGLATGLFFSPYFPQNLNFYWQQSFKIAILNYQHLIGVGGEWYPYLLPDLFLAALPCFLLFIFALVSFISSYRKQTMNSWFFLILSFLFLALTLKSRRYVEYFIPLVVCFSALSINNFLPLIENRLIKIVPKRFHLLAPVILLLVFSPFFTRDLQAIKNSYRNSFSFDKFAQPAEWLKRNSKPGEIVFHSDWDEFPFLFYHNDQNYYLVGLDPTFMYSADKDLYQRWVAITTGESVDNLYQTIKKLFGASYVFVEINSNQAFARNLANNFYFQKVFENKEARIYRVD